MYAGVGSFNSSLVRGIPEFAKAFSTSAIIVGSQIRVILVAGRDMPNQFLSIQYL